MVPSTPYDEMTVSELRAEASRRNIEGRSGMDKEQLIAALHADDDAAFRSFDDGDASAAEEEAASGGMPSLEDTEAARIALDAPVQEEANPDVSVVSNVGPQPPRSAALRPDAKYNSVG